MVNILIVEDEPNYSDTLEMLVDELGYQVIGLAEDGQKALNLFAEKQPDLVLMDIHLKGSLTGIDLAHQFQQIRPTPIIFITSFDDQKTFEQAKQTCPSAYLTKPFEPEALQRSMEIALEQAFAKEDDLQKETTALLAPSCFFVKERNRLIKIKADEIKWVEVDDKYCVVHTTKRKFALRLSLKELADKLDPNIFVQTHRSFLVNAHFIDEIDTGTFVVRIGEHEIPMGKTYKPELLSRLRTL